MKFYPVTDNTLDPSVLNEEYRTAKQLGVLRLGKSCVFFRSGLRTYYVPCSMIHRCFRRVQLVPARMCCGKGDLRVENLVICGDKGELAVVQLPGERAGKAAIQYLSELLPGIPMTKPESSVSRAQEEYAS